MTQLTPQQQQIEFYGDQLTAVLADDGDIYVPINQMCDQLTLNLSGQVQRIQRAEVLASGLQLLPVQTEAGVRPTRCLRVDLVALWLGGISTNAIADDQIRRKVIAYQTSLARVAWAVFGPLRSAVVPRFEGEAAARQMASMLSRMEAIDQAIAHLNQMLQQMAGELERSKAIAVMVEGLKAEFDGLRSEVADLQNRTANAFKVTGERFKQIEVRLNPGARITQEQASRVKEAIAYIANGLQERGQAKPYPAVYHAFYTHFSIVEYGSLPQRRFGEALDWLGRWGAAVQASTQPVPPPE